MVVLFTLAQSVYFYLCFSSLLIVSVVFYVFLVINILSLTALWTIKNLIETGVKRIIIALNLKEIDAFYVSMF